MNNSDENPANVNVYKNLKILGWRVNGDGLNAFRNSEITDCFFRCQDDHFYYGGDNVKISNSVCWSDFNGAVLYVTKGAKSMESSYFKDIKVIYHRAGWHYWEGGRVISFRDRKPGNTIKNVQIKNVLVEDPFPAFPPFYFKMSNPDNSSASVDYDNIIIENVVQEHPGVSGSGDNTHGKPRNTMLGLDDARKFTNITFKNCSYNNKWLGSFEDGDFLVNKYVENITFFLDHVKHQISLSVNNETGGSVSGDGIYSHGEKATVLATAANGYKFAGWTINNDTVSVNPQFTFNVTEDRQLKANFLLLTNTGQDFENTFKFYPNPANDKLYFNFTSQDIDRIQLMDANGKVVYTNNEITQNNPIDLSGYSGGLYFVQVYTAKDVYTAKIIITRN
ncbi:InlB B-repeat-containing protein [Mariniphaga sp.]|uniref:InlB B-repeat-containing protein n=1 Tax=Mariniphaga sp. TaxID=1954475 RepID=UPI003564D554